jgi:cyclic pyranopterin monophosphate synthase
MVDVTEKAPTVREAVARGKVVMNPQTLSLVQGGAMPKGDVLGVAKIAAVMAAKMTGNLIPMCHPLELTGIDVTFHCDTDLGEIVIETRVKTVGRTGVEMEALTAATVAALTIYDMCKSADREMMITDVMLVAKRGGKSGAYERAGAP